MKKSYIMFITIIFLAIFSYSCILILETKALMNKNLSNQYLYIQAKNHLNFFEDFLKDYNFFNINTIQIEDNIFNIYAIKNNKLNLVDIYVKAKKYDISLHKKLHLKKHEKNFQVFLNN